MSSIQAFWQWYRSNEERLFAFDRSQESLLDELAGQFHAVHPDLTFELGPVSDGRRDLVVSAAGMKEAFPAVEELCRGAPSLPRWRILAFRPRRHPINIVSIGERRLDPRYVEVVLLQGKQSVGLYVFIPGYKEGDSTLGQMVYLLLDEALGEYAVETQVGLLKMFPFEASTPGERIPLTELPRHFDNLLAKLGAGA